MTLGVGHNGGPTIEDDERRERPGNWFAVSRDIFDHPIVGIHDRSFTDMEAWLYLLSIAAYAPTEVHNKGSMIVLDPGQMMAAHAYLADRWKWSADKVRWYLKRLEKEAMITRFAAQNSARRHPNQSTNPDTNQHTNQSTNQNTKRNTNQIQIITICKYSIYQYVQQQLHQAKPQASYQPTPQPPHQPEHQPSHQESNTKNNINTKTLKGDVPFAADAAPSLEGLSDDQVVEAIETPPERKKPDPDQRLVLDALEAFGKYNDLAQRIGLPMARTLTPQRRKNLVARLREHGGMEAWQTALNNIERSAFLRGRNNRGWIADFDFLVTASRFAKVVDGVYGNGAHGDEQPRETLEQEAMRLACEMEGRL